MSKCLLRHGVLRVFVSFCVSFCTGNFVMVPINLTYLHCFQHSLFEHLFNLNSVNAEADVTTNKHLQMRFKIRLPERKTVLNKNPDYNAINTVRTVFYTFLNKKELNNNIASTFIYASRLSPS